MSSNPFLSSIIDSLTNSIDIDLNIDLIPAGLTSSFDLTATLVTYPSISHSETFQLKIYQFECYAKQISYEYLIGSSPLQIAFTNEQYPDHLLNRHFEIISIDASSNREFDASNFLSFTTEGDENSSQASNLIVESQNNSDAGLYTVGYKMTYAAD